MQRRNFLGQSAGIAALAMLTPWRATATTSARTIIIGGGFGGATCARYLRLLDPGLAVTLIESDAAFVTCPFSNLVLAGMRTVDEITHTYARLRASAITVIHDTATAIDADNRRVALASGKQLDYDRLIVAPGIALKFDAVPGYDTAAAELMPHAWKAGAQTLLLRRQLEAMNDGGVVVIAAPANPFRCPPGPYERASLIAHYLKQHKPRSKILILDTKDKFSKQSLFQQGWNALYPGMIEWVAGSAGGLVERVEAASRTLVTESGFTEHRADVVNFIPPQEAGQIAQQAELTDASGWCPVNQLSFESLRIPGIHVLGDAAIAGAMPKSGFSANSQAKVCAAAIVAALRGDPIPEASYANTCYSLVGPDYGISVSAVYALTDSAIAAVKGAGGLSPSDADPAFRAREAAYARGWYSSITADTWG